MAEFIFFAMYTGVYSAVFLVIHLVAKGWSYKPWDSWDWVVVLWGVIFALFGMWFYIPGAWLAQTIGLQELPESILSMSSSIGIPGLISLLLVRKSWDSNVVAVSVLFGTVVAILISVLAGMAGWMFVAPFMWNASYAFGCAIENCRLSDRRDVELA
jgi:hypothetical protein